MIRGLKATGSTTGAEVGAAADGVGSALEVIVGIASAGAAVGTAAAAIGLSSISSVRMNSGEAV